MKIAAVVILYHPPETVISNINSYYNYVDKVFVFDNTETEPIFKEQLLKLAKVEYYSNGRNEGIAKRLNKGAAKAIEQQFDWILTMDQDSVFAENAINNYMNCFYHYKNKENTAMFGTRYSRIKNESSPLCKATEIHELITSGTLVNLEAFEKIGCFDEALFIDSVDHDYCIRAKLNGFSIIEFSNIFTLQEVGKEVYTSSIKTLFLYKKKKAIHSPLRCYYMFRNLLYLERKFKGQKADLLKSVRSTVIDQIKACIFYGRDTIKIFKYLIIAYHDFKERKMGKIDREL
ncbi:glycosyltransferase family 2 protein [Segetibacter koreensis]|uniref:glycosyltransferase family 2 protein n=1 Tax=Segetibacter koreensis TaxID=398037 RepID=UPI000368A09B|nr:glycosyltransferase family 2 protein [Segetibacter koreensis]